jgi:1,4-dihydroxy-2-naphthoate octaprenyltransferase
VEPGIMSQTVVRLKPSVESTTPGRIKIWFQAVRFFSFTASVVPILIGSALALVDRSFDLLLFAVMLIASVATHAGSNLANDYFDHRKGIDSTESLGPSGVIQRGYLTASDVLRGMIVAFGIATALGLYIVYRTGWPILIVALLSLAAAVLYTGGPTPLGYIALGEVTVFIFMGLVMVTGSYFVHAGELTLTSVLIAIPVGLLVAAILHANNIRDMEPDAAAGKRTLANVFGRQFANREYAALVYGGFLSVVVVVLTDLALWPLLGVFALLSLAIQLVRIVSGGAGPMEMNGVLRRTAGLHLRFGLMLTGALLFRTVLDRTL